VGHEASSPFDLARRFVVREAPVQRNLESLDDDEEDDNSFVP
jgi:hypothetical protein